MQNRGQQRREAGPSETSSWWTGIPRQCSQVSETSQEVPFLNPNSLNWWSRPQNIAQVWIDCESSWAFLDSGLTINAVTPEFVEVHSLDFGPFSDLSSSTLGINGFRGVFSWPLGYVIIRAQEEGAGAMMKIKWP